MGRGRRVGAAKGHGKTRSRGISEVADRWITPTSDEITGVIGCQVPVTETVTRQLGWSADEQSSSGSSGGSLYLRVTSAGLTPSIRALAAVQALADQCGTVTSSIGMSSLQLVTVLAGASWLTAATRAPCRAAFASVLWATTARPMSTAPVTMNRISGRTKANSISPCPAERARPV